MPNLTRWRRRRRAGSSGTSRPASRPAAGRATSALFGYDPLRYQVGRGVLEALGIDFDLRAGDVAARGNFCTVDARACITDRRAGRISTEVCVRLAERLRTIRLPGVEVLVEPVKEHRFVLVLRGAPLGRRLSETDPQALGTPPLPVRALDAPSERTAVLVNAVRDRGRPLLARRGARQHGPAARLRSAAGPAAIPRGVRPARGGHRRLSDVPRARQARGHGRAQDRRHLRGRDGHAAASTGRPTTSSSSTTRTPTRRARTATSTPRSRRSSASMPSCPTVEASGPTCSS